jgi:NitT/TauT family transport system permease protein
MRDDRRFRYPVLAPFSLVLASVAVWAGICAMGLVPDSLFPSPAAVARGFVEEARRGRLLDDVVASLFRVSVGSLLALGLGIPLGLWMGLRSSVRGTLLPIVNFFRALSPLAWIPFAILWFGIGDTPSIFLIFMSAFFPVVLSTSAAVANVPQVYFRVGRDLRLTGFELYTQVTLPAIMPQLITMLRVTAGLSWLVVVAAEMIAGRDGLGFLIWDARNALRPDLVVVGMVLIGSIGVALDRALEQLTRIPSVRWGYEN